MLEKLYTHPRVLERHRQGPFLQERERYLSHRAELGVAPATLVRLARELLVVAHRIDLKPGTTIAINQIEAAADRWARAQRRCRRSAGLRWSRDLFILTARPWLRFLGRLREPEIIPGPFEALHEDFAHFLQFDCGLSAVTIRNRCWHLRQFGHELNGQRASLPEVLLTDVDSFLARKGSQGWSRVSVATSAKALRAFFHYAESRGWCVSGIASGIESPRLFAQEGLPTGPAWDDVQRLIASVDTGQARDIRNRALLMLLAVYGLRSGEVRKLRLEDLNWEKLTVSIPRSKQRCVDSYPLVPSVGQALARYLQQLRPRSAHREVFLTFSAPFRPLSAGALHHVTSARFLKMSIRSRHRGPHALRHACATHLMAEGLSLKEIGDHLGHRSPSATRVYAKVDLAALRAVAKFDQGGLS